MGNGTPLSNLSILLKVLSMHLTSTLQSFLCAHRCISHTHFAMWPHTFVVDVVHMVHNWFLPRRAQGFRAWLVLDNVIHAFGSLAHDTIPNTLYWWRVLLPQRRAFSFWLFNLCCCT